MYIYIVHVYTNAHIHTSRRLCHTCSVYIHSTCIYKRTHTHFQAAALNAQEAGAVAAVFVNSLAGMPPFVMSGIPGNGVTIPTVMVSAEDGERLAAYMEAGPVTVTLPGGVVVDESSEREAVDRVAFFSSARPLWDFRSKPDVTCPGEHIRSAESHGDGPPLTCGAVVEMSGTSMATPTCAGAAALVRQYFRDGFYGGAGGSSGRRGAGASWHASGALVKAVLIQGATPIQFPRVSALIFVSALEAEFHEHFNGAVGR